MRANVYIFNAEDELLAVIDDYERGLFTDSLGDEIKLDLQISNNHEKAIYVKEGNQVAFRDLDNVFRLFTIKEVNTTIKRNKNLIRALCLPAREELIDAIVEDKRPQNKTAEEALAEALAGTRWKVGNVAELGTASTNFYYENVLKCIEKILETWGGEIVDRIELDGNKIAGRYIDIVASRGSETGKVFRTNKDIEELGEHVLFYPKTALYGIGSSQETDNGGYTRKLKFGDVEWSTANGDPVDKPIGQEWVGDDNARLEFGIKKADGTILHRFGIFEDSQEKDAEKLLEKTWNELQRRQEPIFSYEIKVQTFEQVTGYEHEKVRVGDKVGVISDELKRDIVFQARVTKYIYDIGNIDDAEVTVGNIIDYLDEDDEFETISEIVKDRSGIWDSRTETTDESFPDTVPSVPTNFTAKGLFRVINLTWDFDPSSYIAAYEVYASQVQGFVPDESYLVWRGKSGGYVFQANLGEQWYFRVRAINTHGTASDYSAEISAQTQGINADTEIVEETITKRLLAREALIDAIHIGDGVITNAHIGNLTVDVLKGGSLEGEIISGGVFKGQRIESAELISVTGTFNGDVVRTGTNYITTLDDAEISIKLRSDTERGSTLSSASLTISSYLNEEEQYVSLSPQILFMRNYTTEREFLVNLVQNKVTLDKLGLEVLSNNVTITGGSLNVNGITLENVNGHLRPSANLRLNPGGALRADYQGRVIINDHNNGNISVSGAGSSLYLGYHNTTNVFISQTARMEKDAHVAGNLYLRRARFDIDASSGGSQEGDVAYFAGGWQGAGLYVRGSSGWRRVSLE